MIDYTNENRLLGDFALFFTIASILGSVISIVLVLTGTIHIIPKIKYIVLTSHFLNFWNQSGILIYRFGKDNPKWGYGISVTVGNIDITLLMYLQLEILEIFSILNPKITTNMINYAKSTFIVTHILLLWAADINAFVDWNWQWLNLCDIWGEFVYVSFAVTYENFQALYISYLVYKHVQETDMIEKNSADSPVKTEIAPRLKSAVSQFLNSDSTLARYRRLYYSISLVYLMDFFACICYFLGMADQDLTGKTATNINAIYFMEIGLSFTGIHCTRIGILFHSIRSLKLDSLKFKDEVLKTTKKLKVLREYAKQPTLVNSTVDSKETDTVKVVNHTAVF